MHDEDEDVDGADFLTWQRGVGSANPGFVDGDADADGAVDGNDLAIVLETDTVVPGNTTKVPRKYTVFPLPKSVLLNVTEPPSELIGQQIWKVPNENLDPGSRNMEPRYGGFRVTWFPGPGSRSRLGFEVRCSRFVVQRSRVRTQNLRELQTPNLEREPRTRTWTREPRPWNDVIVIVRFALPGCRLRTTG